MPQGPLRSWVLVSISAWQQQSATRCCCVEDCLLHLQVQSVQQAASAASEQLQELQHEEQQLQQQENSLGQQLSNCRKREVSLMKKVMQQTVGGSCDLCVTPCLQSIDPCSSSVCCLQSATIV